MPPFALDSDDLPDGWERVDGGVLNGEVQFVKFVNRGAVVVEQATSPHTRDAVVVVGPRAVGPIKGPAARLTWTVDNYERVGLQLVEEIQAWIDEGNGPYARGDLQRRLREVVEEIGVNASCPAPV